MTPRGHTACVKKIISDQKHAVPGVQGRVPGFGREWKTIGDCQLRPGWKHPDNEGDSRCGAQCLRAARRRRRNALRHGRGLGSAATGGISMMARAAGRNDGRIRQLHGVCCQDLGPAHQYAAQNGHRHLHAVTFVRYTEFRSTDFGLQRPAANHLFGSNRPMFLFAITYVANIIQSLRHGLARRRSGTNHITMAGPAWPLSPHSSRA